MVDSGDSIDAAEPPNDTTDESRFPAAKFFSAIAVLVVGAALMMVYIVLTGMSHNFNTRQFDLWGWAGIAFQLFAGGLFLWVALDASDIPTTQRSWFVQPAIIGSYVLAAAIFLFDVWVVAQALGLL